MKFCSEFISLSICLSLSLSLAYVSDLSFNVILWSKSYIKHQFFQVFSVPRLVNRIYSVFSRLVLLFLRFGVPEVPLPLHDLPLLRPPGGLAHHQVHPGLQSGGEARVLCTVSPVCTTTSLTRRAGCRAGWEARGGRCLACPPGMFRKVKLCCSAIVILLY